LGRLRAVAQTISYEVRLSLILISFLYLILRLNILDLMKYQKFI
jgi:NADH dehydrogenase.